MLYLALLRGVNVGGQRKVEMGRLKACFERAGMEQVRTYINSGNVIFWNDSLDQTRLAAKLEKAIEAEFGFRVDLLLRDSDSIRAVADKLPDDWANDEAAKCDVMFLWEGFDSADVLDLLTVKPEIDDVRYVPGALLWRADRAKVTRSGMMKIVGTDLYAGMTVRNCNTLRKLAGLMREAGLERDAKVE